MTQQQTINKSYESAKDRLNRLAWFLDNSIPVPGLGGYRIGVDGLIGLIPGIGDALGAVTASYILGEAARLGVPKSVLLQMFFNIAIESIIGLIPFAGDLFDMAWKANIRNVRLIEKYVDAPGRTTQSSRFLAFGLITAVLLFLGFIFLLGLLVLKWFVGLLIA